MSAVLNEIGRRIGTVHGEFHVANYGASASAEPAANVAAILAACEAAKDNGGGAIKFDPVRYDLGTFGSGAVFLFEVEDLENVTFEFGGAELFLTITDNDADVRLFWLYDPIRVVFNQPRFICDGAVAPFSVDGPKAIMLEATGDSGPEIGHVTVNEPYWEGFTITLSTTRSGLATRQMSTLRLRGGVVKNCYYGPNFQAVGDDFIGDWRCHNVRRAYFPYGVSGHRFSIFVENTAADFGAHGCIVIATQPRSDLSAALHATQDIHGDVTFRGDAGMWQSLVNFNHVGASGPQTMRDISVFLNLVEATDVASTDCFKFMSFVDSAGVEETSTTANVWKDIRIDGLLSEVDQSDTSDGVLAIRVSPTELGSIHVGPGLHWLLRRLDGASASDLKLNNWRLYFGAREFVQFKQGDLTSGTLAIDLSKIDGLPFTLKLKTWAKSQRNLAGQDVTYSEDVVTGYNNSGVTISQQNNLVSHSTGTASALTIAASGETLTVAFTNYTNAQAKAVVAVEHIWPLVSIPS